MRVRSLFALLWLAVAPCMATPPTGWTPVGLSGGGAMFTPAISPLNPDRMMLNCDMSAAYLTSDNGTTWRMIHCTQLRSSIRCCPAFHPTQRDVIFAADGASGGMKVTRDGGATWNPIGDLRGELMGAIAIDPDAPDNMLVGISGGIRRSTDGGRTWAPCDGPTGDAVGFHFDRGSAAGTRVCFAATNRGMWRSLDGGQTWQSATHGLREATIEAFAGASSRTSGQCVLYCSQPTVLVNGTLAGGIYRSLDRGNTWQPAGRQGLNNDTRAFDEWAMGPIAQYRCLAASDAHPETVYAFGTNTGVPPPHHATLFRSDDVGITWRSTFQADPRFPSCNVAPDYTVVEDGQYYQDVPGLAIGPGDPDHIVMTDGGCCHISRDGGASWTCGHTAPASSTSAPKPGTAWRCTGLVVTTTWDYAIDPFRPSRHFICYTDIGLAVSDDRGATWRWWSQKGRAPWRNTCYQLAFDPQVQGRVWGAFSNVHDIPNANIIFERHRHNMPGGVCISNDHGDTWQPYAGGLPEAACTSVIVDPRSPQAKRRLYAGFFGPGVFRSEDGGATWMAVNRGLGSDANRRVCRLYLAGNGKLFALVTARRQDGRFASDGVGLYVSTDRGESWRLVNASLPLLWPKDLTVDPTDSRRIYLSACDGNGREEAGLYRTTDGGTTWKRLARKGPEHFGAYLHPTRPGWIYMTLTEGTPESGLYLSRDNGISWAPMRGLPFANAMRVRFDPADPDAIIVTTFGGSVWRGPAAEP